MFKPSYYCHLIVVYPMQYTRAKVDLANLWIIGLMSLYVLYWGTRNGYGLSPITPNSVTYCFPSNLPPYPTAYHSKYYRL